MPKTLIALAVVAIALAGCGSAESRKAHFMAKGQAYLAEGNLDKARVEFRNALQIAPNDAEARYQNGVVAERLGNVREAAGLYQGVIDVDPDHLPARTRLARLLLLGGATDRALEVVKPGLDKHPDDAELLAIRGVGRSRQGDLAGGLGDAERARQLAPDSEDTIASLAGLYDSAGRKDDAQRVLEDGVRRLPKSVDLRSALAQLYGQTGQSDKLEAVLKEIVALQPTEAAHRARLAEFYAQAQRFDEAESSLRQAIHDLPTSTPLKLSLVEFLLSRKGPEAAERELAAMAAANPKDASLQFALARLYESQKQSGKAEATLRAVIDRDPRAASAVQAKDALAAIYMRRNQRPEASKLIAEVLAESPRDNDALMLRAGLELDAGDPKSAIADLRAVLRDQPNAVPVLRTLAQAHVQNGEPALAEEALRRAVAAAPSDTSAALELIAVLETNGKSDEGRALAEGLLARDPKSQLIALAAFHAQMYTKDFAAARATAAATAAAHPDTPLGNYLLGLVAEVQGQDAEAIKNYSRAVDLGPTAPEPLDALVRLLLRTHQADVAHQRLQAMAAKQPNNAHLRSVDGEVLLAMKRLPDAAAAFESAIAIAPHELGPYHGLELVKIASGDPEGAIAQLKRAQAAVQPPDAASIQLADLYRRLGRRDQAIRTYEDLLRQNPRSDVAANNLAMLLVSGQADAANVKRARSLVARFDGTQVPQYMDTDGWVRLKDGEVDGALSTLEKAVSLQPASPTFRFHLAMAELQAGHTPEARRNLQTALNAGDRFEGAQEAKAALAQVAEPQPSRP
jgi:tetratricopeptide (TPR) repeat protein